MVVHVLAVGQGARPARRVAHAGALIDTDLADRARSIIS